MNHTPDTVGPTEQTKAKLKADVVLRLYQQGRLNCAQLKAAEEIRDIWEAIGRGLFPFRGTDDPMLRSANRGSFRHPVDRMSGHEERAWRENYCPWKEVMAAPAFAGRPVTIHALVHEVVVGNRGPRQLEDELGVRHGTVFGVLSEALQTYAEIAGWSTRRKSA